VARADYLELEFGSAQWMRRAYRVLLLLCILAISISPAPWSWKLSAWALLAIVWLLSSLVTGLSANRGKVRLYRDNSAMLSTAIERRVFASLAERHWVSPWFCSIGVHLARGGARRFLLVCRAGNDEDEYRRLLVFLRMRPNSSEAERMIW
jgi:hypothetical protein